MSVPVTEGGVFARHFKESYLRSLHDPRFFYDDITEVGNPAEAKYVFYFVPGMNGTPGQMRFLLPSLTRVFGSQIHLKALHLPQFSARVPTWEKYTPENVSLKISRLREDLTELLERFERIAVLTSSNGFYDFAAAVQSFPAAEIESRVHLAWGACAPDRFEPSVWEKIFFPLNGFVHGGHRWWAYPNHNAFIFFNPETSTSYNWPEGSRPLFKCDLESRFRCFGLQWDYLSPTQLGEAALQATTKIRRPWWGEAEVLIAENDGYWQGTPRDDIEAHIRRYIPHAHCEFKPHSHLWVVNPTNVTELFERLKPRLPALVPARETIQPRSTRVPRIPARRPTEGTAPEFAPA